MSGEIPDEIYLSRSLPEAVDPLLRITIHNASWDYEGNSPRHGTRVRALAEETFFDEQAPTRRQALGLAGSDD